LDKTDLFDVCLVLQGHKVKAKGDKYKRFSSLGFNLNMFGQIVKFSDYKIGRLNPN